MSQSAMNFDKFMKIEKVQNTNLKKYDVLNSEEFTILGLPFVHLNNNYNRNSKNFMDEINKVNPALHHLGNYTAGVGVTFKTNTTKLVIKVKLNKSAVLWHMAPTCEVGFDLYIDINKELKFYNISRMEKGLMESETVLFENFDNREKEILINFPLYSGVISLEILIDEEAYIHKYSRFKGKKWLFYGTSITQGGCASRPGMCYTNILSRHYSKEIINLGYSGNGLGEIVIAEMINEIENLEMVFIDYDANAGALNKIEETLENFIVMLKEKNRDLKVVVISRVNQIKQYADQEIFDKYHKYRLFEIDTVQKLDLKYKNVYFIDGLELFKEDFDEYTVDGVHFTDLGFYMFSKNMIPFIDKIRQG